jgi:hypothetical protein
MLNNIPEDSRKRFMIIVFIVLPILSTLGFLLGTKIAMAVFNFQVNLAGAIFVTFLILITYIRCVAVVYRKLRKKSEITKS